MPLADRRFRRAASETGQRHFHEQPLLPRIEAWKRRAPAVPDMLGAKVALSRTSTSVVRTDQACGQHTAPRGRFRLRSSEAAAAHGKMR